MTPAPPFRLASSEERAYYTHRLYPLQDRIFERLAPYNEALVLTGGTALARHYLGHQYSDDIDLFTGEPRAGTLGRDLANTLQRAGFSLRTITASVHFFRAMVSDGDTEIRVDVAPDSPRVEAPQRCALGVYVHSLRDIAANKISAFEDRSEVKDVVDRYYLRQRLSWTQMFADAELKRVPIGYDDLRHFLAMPLSGEALLGAPISQADFDAFASDLRLAVADEIKKKVDESSRRIEDLVSNLLWDTPRESRTLNERTRPVLKRRAEQLPLPERIALLRVVDAASAAHD